MKPSSLAINPIAAAQLLIQEMGDDTSCDTSLSGSLVCVNAARIDKGWPLVTSMSCFNPVLTPPDETPLNVLLEPLRAHWQSGLTLILKNDPHNGLLQMLACCKPLAEHQGEHPLSQIARVYMEWFPLVETKDIPVIIQLASRFDIFLRDAQSLLPIPAEALLRDSLFYLSLTQPEAFKAAWEWNDNGITQLQSRMRWESKQLASLLYPTQDTDTIEKSQIEKFFIPVTDALLYLNEIQLRTRFMLRINKIDARMLKFAVPVQMLMAEAMRLSV